MGLVVNPSLYVGTLGIRMQTGDHPQCGVRSGRHNGFRAEWEMNQPMPRFQIPAEPADVANGVPSWEGLGFYDYVIDRPETRAGEHMRLEYNYVVTAWHDVVYSEGYPDVWTLALHETTEGWDAHFGRIGTYGLTLILPDYEPGWIQRTNAQAL